MDQPKHPLTATPLEGFDPFDDGKRIPAADAKIGDYWPPDIPKPPTRHDWQWGSFKLGKNVRDVALGACATAAVVGTGCSYLPDTMTPVQSTLQASNGAISIDLPPPTAARTTVVLDLGHGPHMKRTKEGGLKQVNDPGAMYERDGQPDILESNVTAAMGARMALQLLPKRLDVVFTRPIDSRKNPHLQDLTEDEHKILAGIDSKAEPFSVGELYNARIETARAVHARDPKALYLVLHADKAPSKGPTTERRGGAAYLHPKASTKGPSYRFTMNIAHALENAPGGSLLINRKKGIIPAAKGHAALFGADCEPEKGAAVRTVGIISPVPVRSIKHGLGTMTTSLLEMGFLNNPSDVWRLTNREWATNYASVVANSIDQFVAREYEGAKAPPTNKIMLKGKEVTVLPKDPKKAEKVLEAMARAIPAEKERTATIVTESKTLCKPSGEKYQARVARYQYITPQPEAGAAKADGPRKPIDHATRDDAPRTRS